DFVPCGRLSWDSEKRLKRLSLLTIPANRQTPRHESKYPRSVGSHRLAVLKERILLTPLRNQRRLKRLSLAKSERVSNRSSFESYASVAALCGPTVLNTEIGSYSSDRRSRQHTSRSESEASRSCTC